MITLSLYSLSLESTPIWLKNNAIIAKQFFFGMQPYINCRQPASPYRASHSSEESEPTAPETVNNTPHEYAKNNLDWKIIIIELALPRNADKPFSPAELLTASILSAVAGKIIQRDCSPKKLLALVGSCVLANATIWAENAVTKPSNLNLMIQYLIFYAGQNPEAIYAAYTRIKEIGFKHALGEFLESTLKGLSQNQSRADRIAFIVRTFAPHLVLLRPNMLPSVKVRGLYAEAIGAIKAQEYPKAA